MKKQRIYIDTSVIGGCFDHEFSQWLNGLVKDFEAGIFIPILSELVAEELKLAPISVREKYFELLGLGAPMLLINDEVRELLAIYQQRQILTDKCRNDMLHIAIATVEEVNILVSWNFKHIVRFDKIRSFNSTNVEAGYKPLEIYSPREVTVYGNY